MASILWNHDMKPIERVSKLVVSPKMDMNRISDLALVFDFYSLQINRNAARLMYDIFITKDTTDNEEMPKNVIKPVTYGHLFCSSFQFAPSQKAPFSQLPEDCSIIASDNGDWGSESKNGGSAKKQGMIEKTYVSTAL